MPRPTNRRPMLALAATAKVSLGVLLLCLFALAIAALPAETLVVFAVLAVMAGTAAGLHQRSLPAARHRLAPLDHAGLVAAGALAARCAWPA